MNGKPQTIPSAIFTLILAAVLLSGSALARHLDTDSLSPFSIVIKTGDAGFDLICKQGCAWERLQFTPPVDGGAQAVDHWGMTSSQSTDRDERADDASFVFTIIGADDRISLMGFKGTAWDTLSFSCPRRGCKQAIDQYGMSDVVVSR